MTRTTIALPDERHDRLERERRRREALAAYLPSGAAQPRTDGEPRHIPFAALGASGFHDDSRRVKEILREEWTPDRLVREGCCS